MYNTQENRWSQVSSPPNSVFQGAAAATSGIMAPKFIYVVGGGSAINQIYNPQNDSWTLGASMPSLEGNRLGLSVAVSNDVVFAVGGINTVNSGAINVLANTDEYLPISYGSATLPADEQDHFLTVGSIALIAVISVFALLMIILAKNYNRKSRLREN